MPASSKYLAVAVLLAAWPAVAQKPAERSAGPLPPNPSAASIAFSSERLVESIQERALSQLIGEVLERNPGVASAEARARAADQRVPQARALPDPVAGLTAFLATPETRTGPQRLTASISQGLPWFGTLTLRERAALYEAIALQAEVEAKRLKLTTDVRRLYFELAFATRYREISEELRAHLVQHEEISRARYSTGVGLGQSVVKLQAEITRIDNELLDIDTRLAALAVELNSLRDRPPSTGVPLEPLPDAVEVGLEAKSLLASALRLRPELSAADARISRAGTLVRLAEKTYRPDLRVGLTYTIVDPRDDAPGRLLPPEGNGDDIFGIQGGITVPIRRQKLAAGVQEAVEVQSAAEEAKREIAAAVGAAVGDLIERLPRSWRQLRLLEDLLIVQAEEALESAQAGYVTGTLGALDLLDAEHVLFEARTAVARANTDYLIGLARLEGAVGEPLRTTPITERPRP